MLRQISMVLTMSVLSPAVLSAAEGPCKTVEHSKASFDQSGEFQGCKLTKVDEDSLYSKLGLKVGDIVHPEGYPVKEAHVKAITLKSMQKTASEDTSQSER